MVQLRTIMAVADNTGAKRLQVLRVHGGARKRYGRLGDLLTCVVKEAVPRAAIKKGDVVHAVLVRAVKETRRKDGSYVRFDENAAVIIDKKSKEPKGTRIFGPIARELRANGYTKILSLAPEVV